MNQNLSPKEWQTLSAYIDGQLSERERRHLETRLKAQPELRTGLEEMKRTRALLRSLPKRRASRNFTLTPAMVQPRKTAQVYPFLRLASAFASFLLIITFLGELALARSMPGLTASEPASEAYTLKSQPETVDGTRDEVPPYAPPLPEGMGGGLDSEGDPSSAEGNALRSMQAPIDPTEQAATAQAAAPPGLGEGPEETPMAMLAAPEETPLPGPAAQAEMAPPDQPAYPAQEQALETGEIAEEGYPSTLMAPSAEDASRESTGFTLQDAGRMFDPRSLFGALKLILVIVALITGLSAFYLRGKMTP